MEYKVPPWKHQHVGIGKAAFTSDFAFFFEPGTGKTSTTINVLRQKYAEQSPLRLLRTLVLCPPIVIKNWRDEWLMHSKIDPKHIIMLTGSGKQRLALFEKHAYEEELRRGKIFITNYEALLMEPLYDAILEWEPEAVVYDESQKCKDFKAKRTKLAAAISMGKQNKDGSWERRPPAHRYILSGSPVLNSPLDLFSQYILLDGGKTFGRNFYAFRGRFFRDVNAGMPKSKYFPDWQIIPGSLEQINQLLFDPSRGGIAMRVLKKDCLDLPPLLRQVIKVGMTPKQALMYKQMKEDFLTFIERENRDPSPVAATLAITKALRLSQICSGYVKTVEGEEISLEETPKMEALRELLSELAPHHKVIIWSVFKENYAQIRRVCEELGLQYTEVNGETPANQRFKNVEYFNTDPKCRVFSGHPGSGGIGINLVQSNISVFYSRNFSLEQSLQAEARNYRGGSEIHESVTRYDIVVEGTIDEAIADRLAEKQDISAKVLGDLVRAEKPLA